MFTDSYDKGKGSGKGSAKARGKPPKAPNNSSPLPADPVVGPIQSETQQQPAMSAAGPGPGSTAPGKLAQGVAAEVAAEIRPAESMGFKKGLKWKWMADHNREQEERDRKAKEDAERQQQEREREEQERRQQEEAAREAEQRAKEEEKRLAEEAEKKAQEEAHKLKEEHERKVKEETARKAEQLARKPIRPRIEHDDFEDTLFTPLPSLPTVKPTEQQDRDKTLKKAVVRTSSLAAGELVKEDVAKPKDKKQTLHETMAKKEHELVEKDKERSKNKSHDIKGTEQQRPADPRPEQRSERAEAKGGAQEVKAAAAAALVEPPMETLADRIKRAKRAPLAEESEASALPGQAQGQGQTQPSVQRQPSLDKKPGLREQESVTQDIRTLLDETVLPLVEVRTGDVKAKAGPVGGTDLKDASKAVVKAKASPAQESKGPKDVKRSADEPQLQQKRLKETGAAVKDELGSVPVSKPGPVDPAERTQPDSKGREAADKGKEAVDKQIKSLKHRDASQKDHDGNQKDRGSNATKHTAVEDSKELQVSEGRRKDANTTATTTASGVKVEEKASASQGPVHPEVVTQGREGRAEAIEVDGEGSRLKRPADPDGAAGSSGREAKRAKTSTGGSGSKDGKAPASGAAKAHTNKGDSDMRQQRVVECFVEGLQLASQSVDLGKIRSFKELWAHLAAAFPSGLPDKMDAKLIYLDADGDWMMVTPDEHWSSFVNAATKILISSKC